MASTIDHDIGGFEIAVQHPFIVSRGQARAKLARDFERFVRRQTADAAKQGVQVLAVHVFHGNVGQALRFADVIDAANIGMRDLARDSNLVVEALQKFWIARELRPAGT